jgi:hypothetical protein
MAMRRMNDENAGNKVQTFAVETAVQEPFVGINRRDVMIR